MYNLYTEQWRKHQISDQEVIPPTTYAPCAVAIGSCIYMFDGRDRILKEQTNSLWTLTRTHGCFHRSEVDNQNGVKLPSPRYQHRGWEYKGQLWIFGGYGSPLDRHHREYGDFAVNTTRGDGEGANNQLLCYDPSTQKWTNPECSGSVPLPRFNHASSIIQKKVWLRGGANENYRDLDDLFQLDMNSHIWTQIESGQIKPDSLDSIKYSLTAISETELILVNVLWEGSCHSHYSSDAWIMDLTSQSWKKYASPRDHRCWHNAVVSCVNRSVTVTGGYKGCTGGSYTPTYHVMLEPKSLQQLAMKTI